MGVIDVPLRIINHKKLVCNLYKRSIRALQSIYDNTRGRDDFRYHAVLLRARFDENRDICLDDAKQLVLEGEKELVSRAPLVIMKFAGSYGELLHNREAIITDAVLDFWHPLEKAAYPEYFARREQRKLEFIKWWDKTYGPKPDGGLCKGPKKDPCKAEP